MFKRCMNWEERKKEAKKVVKVCRSVDPNAFINVIPMDQIYGRFYKKPIK